MNQEKNTHRNQCNYHQDLVAEKVVHAFNNKIHVLSGVKRYCSNRNCRFKSQKSKGIKDQLRLLKPEGLSSESGRLMCLSEIVL